MRRKLLVVDDNIINRELLSMMLQQDFDVLEAEDGLAALDILERDHAGISAVLLDILMPRLDGYETLRRIRASKRYSSLPVIMITGSDDEETRVKSLSLGANDFVMKPYSAEVIKHCLKNQISFREAEATVEALLRDRLTGVYNRDAFHEKAEKLIEEAPEGTYILCCVDINDFKVINDQHGSEAGDKALIALAGTLMKYCRQQGGICGRTYADNFAALCPENCGEDFGETVEQLRKAVLKSTGLWLDLSAGIYHVLDKSLGVSAMYDRAKIAQSTVKGRFDASVAEFDPSMLVDILQKQELVSQMSGALAGGQFEVWYQPQYNHLTGAATGAEALVRWRHPEKGLIPPGIFIPVFEQNGFVYAVDKFVWEEVCKNLRLWIDGGLEPLPISVNISRYDMLRGDLVEVVTGLMSKYRLPPELLRLEITESAFAHDSAQIIAVVKRLVDCGFTVEIDDFGSGYSSLNTLKDVPAQVLKLDMKFLQNSGGSDRGGNIVESVVRMAKWLGMAVIAEGVEEASQADYLASIGCCYIQGYYYGRPLPLADYAALSASAAKERRLVALETVENLDSNAFWDYASMDSLIFNSFVGAACIFELFNGRIDLIRVSKKYGRLFRSADFSIESAMKLNWADYISAVDMKLVEGCLARSMELQEDVACDLTFSGLPSLPDKVYLRFHLRVIATAGERRLVYCIYENITDQRLAELRESSYAARLQAVLESVSSGVTVSIIRDDGSAEVLMGTDRYYRLLGYTKEQYNSELDNAFATIVAEDLDAVQEAALEVVGSGYTRTVEFRALRRDGRVVWLQATMSMASFPDVEDPVQIGVFTDVTEMKKSRETARISEREYGIAVRDSGKLIYRYNHADSSVDMPKEAAEVFGFTPHIDNVPDSLIATGKVSKDSLERYRDFFRAIRRGDREGESSVCRRIGNGEWRWYSIRFDNVFDDNGRPISAIIASDDITEQREKEAVYEKWQRSLLDKESQSFTLYRWNLSQDEIIGAVQGQLLYFRANLAKSSFDKRTESFVENYVHPDDREAYCQFMDPQRLMADYHMGRRNQLLEYRGVMPDGRVLWLRLTVELVEYPDSSDVCAFLLYEDIDEAKKNELLMRQRAETDPLTGLLNRGAFEEKLEKLPAKKGRKPLLSALMIIDMDGFKLVNDSFGHAVGDETLIEIAQKLQENFRQQDLLCRLGGDEFLAYMYDIHGVEAVRDKAALICALLHKSFSVEVQLSASIGVAMCGEGEDYEALYRKADAALYHVKESGKDGYALYDDGMEDKSRTAVRNEEEPPQPQPPQSRGPMRRMLIVEDNEVNRDYLVSLFMDDFIIETATGGASALVRLRRYGAGISIVLLDLRMPGMDGFEVLRKLRADIATQSIPVIVVSGMDERETALTAIREGASDFITKPVDGDLLRLRVASALSKAENEQLRAQNRLLAIQNEETKRLAEAKRHSEELTLALRAAEQADVAKTHFLSSMSHEIRTPLNAVIGFNSIARSQLQAAGRGTGDGEAVMGVMDSLSKSEIACRQLLSIINDVLDISAIEAGKIRVEEAPFDFRGLISALTVIFFSQARAKGVDFQVLFERPTEEWYVGDQMRINQVLTNLLSNAVKFTPEGGSVTFTVKEYASSDVTADFVFEVKDTGIGMTEEYLRHIFTPFEQAEASISRRFGGSGLGLAITKNLVGLMGGEVQVKSESGVGSVFTVRLPLRRTEQPLAPASADFSDIKALVVDDDVSTCDYIKLMFDRCGARCTTCTTGERALELYALAKEQEKPFNLCLVDWRMPGMDGFETIREIRRLSGSKLPIVVVTAYDFSEISEKAAKLGINRFLAKPLFQSSIYDLLATVGGRRLAAVSELETKQDFNGARVLLVEDNNMNMEVAKQILSSAKLEVDSAWNGQEALDIYNASKPGTYKVILMDVHMPQMDGYEASRRIRASGRPDANTVPIIAMTADAFAEDVAEAKDAGMNEHIGKPVDVDALYRLLTAYIKENGQ